MKPHSLSTAKLTDAKTPAQIKAEQGWAGRHGYHWPKGTVLPETHVLACPRIKMADLPVGFIPPRLYERNLEQNQQVASCCRHPENHEIEAFRSHPEERLPDIYIFHCTCGRKHRVFCIGKTGERPEWKAE